MLPGVCLCPGGRGLFSDETIAAQTIKIGGVAGNLSGKMGCCLPAELFIRFNPDVLDTTASFADKVTVLRKICVKVKCAVTYIYRLNLAGIPQQKQIAIDGAETDIGKNLSHTGINSICGRMIGPSVQIFVDSLALFAVFVYHDCPFQ